MLVDCRELLESLQKVDVDTLTTTVVADSVDSADDARDGLESDGNINEASKHGEDRDKNEFEETLLVDHALRDALSKPRHRDTVLHMEHEVEQFLESSDSHYVFRGNMTTYERLLAHRTAQHWGLETASVTAAGPDHGCIVATKTAGTGPPSIRLASLEVPMEQENEGMNGSTAPKLLVRKGKQRHSAGNGHMNVGHSRIRQGHIEDKEQHYERAKARIFGESAQAAMGYPNLPVSGAMSHMLPFPYQMRPHVLPNGGQGMNVVNYASARTPQGKAQLRNRQEDLTDPDFRRGGSRNGIRYNPGFGEDGQSSMYMQQTYASEYPDLGHGSGTKSPKGPAGSGPYGPSGYAPTMVAPIPYGFSNVYAQTSAGTPMQFSGQYMPMPYGYIPVRPGPDGIMMPMAMFGPNGAAPAMFSGMNPSTMYHANGGKGMNFGNRGGRRGGNGNRGANYGNAPREQQNQDTKNMTNEQSKSLEQE